MLCEYKIEFVCIFYRNHYRVDIRLSWQFTLNGKRVANKMPEFDNLSWKDRRTVADISF